MTRKRTPWNERKRLSGSSSRLRDWKDDGTIVLFVHTQSGITPRLFHLVPYPGEDDNGKPTIRFFPFICHEEPKAYFNRVPAQHCPIDRLIELIADDGRIDDDEIVWEAAIGKKDKDRFVTKEDFCGFKNADWRGSFKPRAQYVLVGVEPEKIEEGLRVAVEPISLGDALIKCVNNEIDSNGEELGDPGITPYAFKFVYDKNASKPADYYTAYAFRRAELTPEIKKLLESEPVDISNWIDPGNSADLRKIFEKCLKIDVDLDMLFDSVLDPDSTESRNKATQEKPSDETEENDDDNEAEQESDGDDQEICELCNGTGKVGKKGLTCPECEGSGLVEAEASEQPEASETNDEPDEVICETCDGSGTVGKKKSKCPDCDGKGTVIEGEESEPEPPPKEEKKKRSRSGKKSSEKKSSQKKSAEEEIDSNTTCGKCKRMIPDDAEICPFCGIEFAD